MALITLSAYSGSSTINNKLSAFGPNASGIYDGLTIVTTFASPVTAFITGYTFTNNTPYAPEGAIWTFDASSLASLPLQFTSTGFTLGLSAQVGEYSVGPYAATLDFTLSSTCLTGAAWTRSAVTTTSQTLSFALTAVDLPYGPTASVVLSAYTGVSTINKSLSAFGPNASGIYDGLTIGFTTTSPVTTFITGYTFNNVTPYEPEGACWTLDATNLASLPLKVTNTGFTLGLSAQVGETAVGNFAATLVITLSSTCLIEGIPATVSNTTQTLTFPITAVNLPYHGQPSYDRFRRLWLGGYIG
jgi:hypothetical protein